jgi:hypothetical protein
MAGIAPRQRDSVRNIRPNVFHDTNAPGHRMNAFFLKVKERQPEF